MKLALWLLQQNRNTLSQGKEKEGDEVEDDDDDDDDMVRTSVSKDRVTATLCNEELFLRTQYSIYRFPHISIR
jgi:hypothetical protein